MVQLVQKFSSHSSVFEMRWFSWFRNYHRTYQHLRRDEGQLDSFFLKAELKFPLKTGKKFRLIKTEKKNVYKQ